MSQQKGSISIGYNTGASNVSRPQGEYSIALGGFAGHTGICNNSIIINATGANLRIILVHRDYL